ncbi:MAG TPA: hypothetical protein VIC55_06195, partial [Gemmatimonadaceae bacterium]
MSRVSRIRVALMCLIVPGPLAAQSAPSVSPQGSGYSEPPNTTGLTLQFTVYNNDDFSERFILTCTTSGNIGPCTRPSSILVPAWGASNVNVGFSTGAVGTGQLSLTAGDPGGMSQGWYAITVAPPPAPAVSVTPDGMPANVATNSTGLSYTFTVTNTGNANGTVTLSTTSCVAPAISCGAPSPASVLLTPNQSSQVTVGYATNSTPATGGLVRLHGVV